MIKSREKSALGPILIAFCAPRPWAIQLLAKATGKDHNNETWQKEVDAKVKATSRRWSIKKNRVSIERFFIFNFYLFGNTHLLHVILFCVCFLRLRGGEMGVNDSIFAFCVTPRAITSI